MAGETTKTEAICVRISPWSRTSHIVTWMTPTGKITTVVKGAVRAKSMFLGQYDLNYTCEIVHYNGTKNELCPLRECSPTKLREDLRGDYRSLLLAEHFRRVVLDIGSFGPDSEDWYNLLSTSLDALPVTRAEIPRALLTFELKALHLAGLSPEVDAQSGAFILRGERKIPISDEVAHCLISPQMVKYTNILLEAIRAIGAFYAYHLDGAPETRRAVLQTI